MSLSAEMPIGVFDSGLGGLTVLRELRRLLPDERFVYLGDTARTPYGPKSPETIRIYAKECAQFLMRHEIKLLIVACNTVSAVALDELSLGSNIPVLGTIDPAVAAVRSLGLEAKVGVVGTQATMASRSYENRLLEFLPSSQVFSKACPLFVPLVEQGMYEGEIVDKVIELYLRDFKAVELDAIILGCTHYPMLAPSIRRFLGPTVKIIECSTAVASEAKKLISGQQLLRKNGQLLADGERYFVTDDVNRFNSLASLILEGQAIQAVKIEQLS